MKRIFFILLIYLSALLPVPAQVLGVKVRPAQTELIQTEPRQVVTTVFRVTNLSGEKREFLAELKLPGGWKEITREFPFSLNPGQTDARLVSFFIPGTTLADKYPVTYQVRDRRKLSVGDYYTVYLEVLPVAKLEVTLLDAPELVIAGEVYQTKFLIINRSNKKARVDFEIESTPSYPFRVDLEEKAKKDNNKNEQEEDNKPEKLELSPGESKVITVRVTTSLLRYKVKHFLKLTAEIKNLIKGTTQASATGSVDVIPPVTGVDERFHKLPLVLKLISLGGKNGGGFQGSISGAGTLDEAGGTFINFLFKTPDSIEKSSIFGERDEYRFSLETKYYQLNLGDRSYSLTPLTEYYRYGRGAELKFNLKNFTIGGFYQESRWQSPQENETAAFINYLGKGKYQLGLNYLKKKAADPDEIWSLRGLFKPFKNNSLELEYALGQKDNAYHILTSGYLKKTSYLLKIIHSGPEFMGYYRNLDLKSGSLSTPLGKNLNIDLNYREVKENFSTDPADSSTPLDKYYKAGLRYRFKSGTTLTLDYRIREREDLLSSSQLDTQENTLGAGISKSFKKFSLYLASRFGKTKDWLLGNDSGYDEYTFSAYYRPNSKQSYSGFFQLNDNAEVVGENQRKVTAGLEVYWQLLERTRFFASFRSSENQNQESYNQNLLDIRINHKLLNGQSLSLRARQTISQNSESETSIAWMAEYIIPFGLALSRKKSIGIVRGRVFDEENQEYLSGLVIRINGATAVTDKLGEFIFPALKPGTYYLNLDREGIGFNKVPREKMPLEVEVKGGEELELEIAVVRSARISGRIVVYAFESKAHLNEKDKKKLIKSHGLANALLELENGVEVLRIMTDHKGSFQFEDLRPGKWTLKVDVANLPEYHYLEKNNLVFELMPGEEEEVILKVLPKIRTIRMLEENEILIEEDE